MGESVKKKDLVRIICKNIFLAISFIIIDLLMDETLKTSMINTVTMVFIFLIFDITWLRKKTQ